VASKTFFGVRLRALRERMGLSQAALAEKTGLGQKTISTWEQGTREPVWSNVLALAEALGVSVLEFAEGKVAAAKGKPGRPKKG
jgi:transcriptional regulator with XRE-family HTH domain